MNNNELLQAMSLMMDEKFGKRFDAMEEDIKGLKSIVAEKTAEWMKPKKK
jgi:hypothetical protein